MKTGIELITEARAKKLAEPYPCANTEDQHYNGELAAHASCYAKFAQLQEIGDWTFDEMREISLRSWQVNTDDFKPSTDQIENLAQAGQLIIAEIERIQRIRQERDEYRRKKAKKL